MLRESPAIIRSTGLACLFQLTACTRSKQHEYGHSVIWEHADHMPKAAFRQLQVC